MKNERLENYPLVSIITINYNGTNGIIQYAGSSLVSPYTGRNKMNGHKQKDNEIYSISIETHYAHGAAMLFPKNLLNEIGLMEDLYFLYYEELDFCERIKD